MHVFKIIIERASLHWSLSNLKSQSFLIHFCFLFVSHLRNWERDQFRVAERINSYWRFPFFYLFIHKITNQNKKKLFDCISTLFLEIVNIKLLNHKRYHRVNTICKLEQSLITFLFAYQICMFCCHLYAALLQSIIKSLAKFASECYNSRFLCYLKSDLTASQKVSPSLILGCLQGLALHYASRPLGLCFCSVHSMNLLPQCF